MPFLLFQPWIAACRTCASCSKDAFGRSAFLKSMLFRTRRQSIHAASHMSPGNPCYFVRLCKENARIDEIVWMPAPLLFRGIEHKLPNWYFANIVADEGRMPGANPYYVVATCIRTGKSERNSIDELFQLLHFIVDLGLAVSFPYSFVGDRPTFATLRLSLPATAMTKRCAIGGVSYGAVFVSKDASLRAHQYTPWAINSRCLCCRK